MTDDELIAAAENVLRPHRASNGRLFGDVGAAVLSEGGGVYTGVCVDTSGWGLCAERSALATMITAGEYGIRKVVAVWKDEKTRKLHVLPPCGICQQFMRDIEERNQDAEVILGRDQTKKLRELMPFNQDWPNPLDN